MLLLSGLIVVCVCFILVDLSMTLINETFSDLADFKFVKNRTRQPHFVNDGFGPFTLERTELRRRIIEHARSGLNGRDGAVHITSCRASGKTTLLHMVGEDLLDAGETVYYFYHSGLLNLVLGEISTLDDKLTRRVFFLVDETQVNPECPAFNFLLKIAKNIVTIGTGLPHSPSSTAHFPLRLKTSDLLLKDEDLKKEGVFEYFVGDHTASKVQVCELVSYLLRETGGSVHPLMRLAELLVTAVKNGATAKDQIEHYGSRRFRESKEFQSMCSRILPSLDGIDVLQFLCSGARADIRSKDKLVKAGFTDNDGKVLSYLLFEAYMASFGTKTIFLRDLREGVDGMEQILRFGLPRMQWTQYDEHYGPIEDSLTVELLRAITELQQVGCSLYNPRLVCADESTKRPDMFFNDVVKTYVEALLTKVYNKDARRQLDDRISRFHKPENPKAAWYKIQEGRHWAVLNFQMFCAPPVEPLQSSHQEVFEQHVFTFIMPTKQIFRGRKCIDSGNSSAVTAY